MKSTFAITSEAASLREMRKWLRSALAEGGLPSEDADAITLAVDEACTNVIRHAYGGKPGCPIRVRLELGPRRVRCVVRDFGSPCDLSRIPAETQCEPRRELRAGGFGVHIMREVFGRVEYRRRPRGTELLLVFER